MSDQELALQPIPAVEGDWDAPLTDDEQDALRALVLEHWGRVPPCLERRETSSITKEPNPPPWRDREH